MPLNPVHKTRKGQIAVYLLLLLIIIGAMVGLKFVSGGDVKSKIRKVSEMDTIRAAVVYGPNSYRVLTSADGNDSIVGINYHLLREFRDSMGVVLQMYPVIDRDEALAKVARGQYDILASLPADNFIRENFLTSGEISLDKLVLLQLLDNSNIHPIRSALDLAADTVHVEKGSAAVRRIDNLMREIGDSIHIVEEEGLSEEYLAMKVATGAWRYAVVNEKTAVEMKLTYPQLDYSTPVSFTQFQVWVLPPDRDSLLNKVNKFLNSRKASQK